VDSFTGEIMTGQAVFQSAMCGELDLPSPFFPFPPFPLPSFADSLLLGIPAERTMAVGVNSGPMVHYVDEETVECSVELPNREGELSFPRRVFATSLTSCGSSILIAYDEKPSPEQYLKIQPLDSFIDVSLQLSFLFSPPSL